MAEPCSPEEVKKMAVEFNGNAQRDTGIEEIDLTHKNVVESAAVGMAQKNLGWFSNFRTMSATFGKYLTTNAINKIVQNDVKRNNFVGDVFASYNKAIKPIMNAWEQKVVGLDPKKADILFTVYKEIGEDLKHKSSDLVKKYGAPYVKAAEELRKVTNNLNKEAGMTFETFEDYMTFFKGRGNKAWIDSPTKTEAEQMYMLTLQPQNKQLLRTFERMAHQMGDDDHPATALSGFLHAVGNHRMQQSFKQVERDVIIPYLDASFYTDLQGQKTLMVNNKVILNAWNEYKHHVLGGIQESDRRFGDTLNSMANHFGFAPKSPKHAYQASHALTSMFHMGAMGARPSSIIRQFGQLVPSFAEFGPRYTRQALKMVVDDMMPGPSRGALYQSYRERGLMTSHVESLVQSVDTSRKVGKGINSMADFMLKGVAATDHFTRAATAAASDLRFDKFLNDGRIADLPGLQPIKDAVIKSVNAGKIQEAKDLYALENLNHLQFFYGKANRPQWMRGALGNMVGTFMSYPMNSIEMMNYFGRRAIQGYKTGNTDDYMPLLRLMLTTGVMLEAGSEFLDADFTSMTVVGAMPHSMGFPKQALDGWKAASSTVEWLAGNLFETGETDFHRQKRLESYRESTRAMKGLIPGFGLYNDINNVLNSGDVARAFALTPTGDKINTENRMKREIRRLNANYD